MPILTNESRKIWTLKTDRSVYVLRVNDDGQLVHGGYSAISKDSPLTAESFDRLDQYADANFSWDRQGRRYELPAFGDTSYHDVALRVNFPQAAKVAPHEANHTPVRDLRLRFVSARILTDAEPALVAMHGQGARDKSPRETLAITLRDAAYDFSATLFYRVTPGCDVIERWVSLRNDTAMEVEITSLAFATLHVPNAPYELTSAAGLWAREFVTQRTLLPQGSTVLSQRGLNTGHASNPFFLLTQPGLVSETGGTVFFGAMAYSGNWSMRFEVAPTSAVRVHAGYEQDDFRLVLKPGEAHTTPAMAFGVCDDGFSGASQRMHAFIRERVLPNHKPGGFRPVLYNGWEATYFKLEEQQQMALARRAAEIGVELFCVDDAWFGARRSDRAGLGDWFVSKDVFPNGLKPLADEVKKLGMKFGLWVEPEMVNPDSDLYRAHPDWVLHWPSRPRTEIRSQLTLDFGRLEVVEYIFGVLDAIVRDEGVDFFKWDMNRYATEPGSVAGYGIWRAHVAGVYSIMDRLRKNHPHLDIQSCSGGGGRIDLGILQRTDQVWTSDNTDAYDRVYIEDGFSLIYPQRVMESWITHEENHQTHRKATLDLRFDVAMRGALGIGTNIDKLSVVEAEIYRRKIAFYKKVRPIVQEGTLHRIATAENGGASIWLTVNADASAAVYSAVILQKFRGYHYPNFKLRALDPAATYAIIDEHDAEIARYSAIQLMTLGIPGDTSLTGGGHANRSRTLLLKRV